MVDKVKIDAELWEIRKLVERLEYDASWDKAGPLYYRLKKMLEETQND